MVIKYIIICFIYWFKVKVFWSVEEVKGIGWYEGWYMVVVEDVIDKDVGRVLIVYVVELLEVYKICVIEMLEERLMWIIDGDEME